MTAQKKSGTLVIAEDAATRITIDDKACKGCEICVEFCPTKVLEMNGFVASVKNLEACIKCMQCELRCPDFAITVHEKKEKQARGQ